VLTSYLVKCPHAGCDWFGSLIPAQDAEPWSGPVPAPVIVFRCPRCQGEWRARRVGEDVRPLPLEEAAVV
jgi:hypothetical protein